MTQSVFGVKDVGGDWVIYKVWESEHCICLGFLYSFTAVITTNQILLGLSDCEF